MNLNPQQRNELFDYASALMFQAKEYDSSGKFQEAVYYYTEAIDKLLVVLKHIHNENDKCQLRALIDQFLRRAEELKSILKKQESPHESRPQLHHDQKLSPSQLQQQHQKNERTNSAVGHSQISVGTTKTSVTTTPSPRSNTKMLPNSQAYLELHPEKRVLVLPTPSVDPPSHRDQIDKLAQELHNIHIPPNPPQNQTPTRSGGNVPSPTSLNLTQSPLVHTPSSNYTQTSRDFPPVIPTAPVFSPNENPFTLQPSTNLTDCGYQPSLPPYSPLNSNYVVSSETINSSLSTGVPMWDRNSYGMHSVPSSAPNITHVNYIQSDSRQQPFVSYNTNFSSMMTTPSTHYNYASFYSLPTPPSSFQGIHSTSPYNLNWNNFVNVQMPNFTDLSTFAEGFAQSEGLLSSGMNSSNTDADKIKIVNYFVTKGFERSHVEQCYNELKRMNLHISPDFVEILKDTLLQVTPPLLPPQHPLLPTPPTHHTETHVITTHSSSSSSSSSSSLSSVIPSAISTVPVNVLINGRVVSPQSTGISSSTTTGFSSLSSPSNSQSTQSSSAPLLQRPVWVPDDKAPNCQLCGQNFTILYRRHHCRGCGRVVCGVCSDKECPIPRLGYFHPVRVCTECYNNTKLVGVKTEFDLSTLRTGTAVVAKTLSEGVSNIGIDAFYKQFMTVVQSMQGTPTTTLSQKELDYIRQQTLFNDNEILEIFQTFKERSPHDIVEWLFAAFHSSYYNYPEHSLTQRSSNLQLLMNSNRTMPQNELSQGSGSGATSTFTSLQTNTHPKTTSLNFFDYIRTLSILAKGDLAARRRWAFLFLYMSSQIITHHKDQRKMESSPILHTNTKSTNNSSSTTIETSQTMNKIASVEESSSSTTIATLQHRVAMSSNEKVWLPPYMDLTQLTLNPEHIISMLTGVVEFFRVLTLNIERKAKRIQEIQSALQHYQHTITLAHYQQAPLVDNIVRLLLDVDPSLHVTVQHLLSSPPTTAENSMVSKHKQGHAVFFGHSNFNLMLNLMFGIQLCVEKTQMDVSIVKKEHFVNHLKYRLPSICENPAVIERRLKASTSSSSNDNHPDNNNNNRQSKLLTDVKVNQSAASSTTSSPFLDTLATTLTSGQVVSSTAEAVVLTTTTTTTTTSEASTSIPIDLDFFYYSFKAYAPNVFRAIRRRFHISEDEFLQSIGIEQFVYNLIFLGTLNSYSHLGSKYLLKTISDNEAKTLMEMLEKYYEHIHSGLTLLAPIVGLYKLTTKQGRTMSIVVMRNVFFTTREMHILYDLKGSSVGRSTLEKDRKPGTPLKDLDFDRKLLLSDSQKQTLREIIQRDAKFLSQQGVMDYSMLLGIHKTQVISTALHSPLVGQLMLSDGGWPSVDGTEVYYWGIIDYLVKFGTRKLLEHTLKAIKYPRVRCQKTDTYKRVFLL